MTHQPPIPKQPEYYVLLADDSAIYQHALTKVLEHSGFSVISTDNGHEALSLYEASPDLWKLVIMDCHMPIMDGFMSAFFIRQFEARNNLTPTSIIGISSDYNKESKKRAFQSGMDNYLPKPLGKQQLLYIAQQYLPSSIC
ncbi:Chemotaxis protein CheY [invertebrate metagenome]|uniref:Chemotaxis protein CheY n=1 Tax=invertebrate metagenome TaxID=1711999 RepID=A0A2H9T9G2_9ZZZZ